MASVNVRMNSGVSRRRTPKTLERALCEKRGAARRSCEEERGGATCLGASNSCRQLEAESKKLETFELRRKEEKRNAA